MNLNKVNIAGNLTRDPDITRLNNGEDIAKFCLAINRVFYRDNGDKQTEVTYVDVTAFGQRATALKNYAKKGMGLFVEGRLKTEKWETEKGEKRQKLVMIADACQFTEKLKKDEAQNAHQDKPKNAPQDEPKNENTAVIEETQSDEDCPF